MKNLGRLNTCYKIVAAIHFHEAVKTTMIALPALMQAYGAKR